MSDIIELDTTGLISPTPVLQTRQKLELMKAGQKLVLTSTCSSASYDIPNFCTQSGHKLLSKRQFGRKFVFEIIRGDNED